jgi:mannose-6-phosphate isomerase-like protein (cupin superfamily)
MKRSQATVIKRSGATSVPRNYGSLLLLTPKTGPLTRLQVLFIRLDPGRSTSRHHHPSDEVFVVLRGGVTCRADDESLVLAPGDTLLIPPGCSHQLENSGDKACELLIALAPPRDPAKVVYAEDSPVTSR